MQIRYTTMPDEAARAYREGAPDAYGSAPERQISDGQGNPCRHCLDLIPKGAEMLVLAYCPFEELQPYAETGPIFLCADACEGYAMQSTQPRALLSSPDYLLKGYGFDDRIVYGTGAIVETGKLAAYATQVFEDPNVAYIHVRSSRNNCYQARIDRG